MRAGFGINYNLGAYNTIAQKLAAQPPFAVSSTSLGTTVLPLQLVDPFARVDGSTTMNSYGIDQRTTWVRRTSGTSICSASCRAT